MRVEPPANRPRVLVVDDDRLVRLSVSEHLSRIGCEVASCDCGERALEWVERWLPQVVLLDIDLPGIDGFATLAELLRVRPGLPVIFMSGRQFDRDQARQKGALDFVAKPFCFGVLDAALARALGARAAS